MGWAPTPPEPTEASIIQTGMEMAQVSELALIQQHVPWNRLFAGETLADLIEETGGLADFLSALGLEIVLLIDPLDGLNRTAEPPELVALNRSILEPEIRAIHEEWVLESVRRIRPAYFGLASEINTLGAHGDPALYTTMIDLVSSLAPQVRVVSPATRVFVSFQVEDAWQRPPFPPSTVDHFSLIGDFDIDALGLSSYPVFSFDTPEEVPNNYLSRFQSATLLPLMIVEGGWSSDDAAAFSGTSPQEQAEYFRRFADLLNGVQGEVWVMLFYADFDATSFGLPPDREAGLANFQSMGIVDRTLAPKPAFSVWQEVFQRPLR